MKIRNEYSPMNMAGLLDEIFSAYGGGFKYYISFQVILGIISAVLSSVLIFFLVSIFYLFDFVGMEGVLFALFTFSVVLINVFSSGAIFITKQYFYREAFNLPLKEVALASFRIFLASLAHALIYLPFFIIFIAVWRIFPMDEIFYRAPIISVLLFFIIIGGGFLCLQTLFSLTLPVALFEKRWFLSAARRSLLLVYQDFKSLAGLRLVSSYSVFLLFLGIQTFIIIIIILVFNETETEALSFVALVTTQTVSSVLWLCGALLISPLPGILSALIYFNQRIKREAFDIEITLERLSERAR